MILQYSKFFINGCILGVFAIGLQILIFDLLSSESSYAYALSSALTYIPLIVLNFFIQRRWIFKRSGMFVRFVFANLVIMLLVSVLSSVFRFIIETQVGGAWGDRVGFILAALLGSVPSFFLKRHWVFAKPASERKMGSC